MTAHDDTANIMRELERELGVRGPANVLRAALKIAKEAAAQAKADDPQPVDPAWMVEVAREAADGYGNGVVAVAERAIELALSRGHVVLAPVVPEADLRGSLNKAWEAGAKSVRDVVHRHIQALMPNVGTEAARVADISAILENLKSGEA